MERPVDRVIRLGNFTLSLFFFFFSSLCLLHFPCGPPWPLVFLFILKPRLVIFPRSLHTLGSADDLDMVV